MLCSTQLFVTLRTTYLPRYSLTCDTKNGALTWSEKIDWARLHWVVRVMDLLNNIIKECCCCKICLPVGPYQNYNEQPFQGKLVWSKSQVVVVGSHRQHCTHQVRPLYLLYILFDSNSVPWSQQPDVLQLP